MLTVSRPPRVFAAISQEDSHGHGRQGSTIVPVNLGGDVPQFHGNIIFAERCQVESGAWWSRHKDISLIVQCTDGSRRFKYPRQSQSCRILRVDGRDSERRQKQLDEAFAAISQKLQKHDVLFHCEQSFHRAPVVAAAVMQRLTGMHAQAGHYY